MGNRTQAAIIRWNGKKKKKAIREDNEHTKLIFTIIIKHIAKLREGKSLFQHKTSTDVTRLIISSASSPAVRFICASWQISHRLQSKLFSCGPISITMSLWRVWGIFHWKKLISHDMRKNISQRNAVLWLCFLCFSTTASEIEATCFLAGDKEIEKDIKKTSKIFIPITISPSSIF